MPKKKKSRRLPGFQQQRSADPLSPKRDLDVLWPTVLGETQVSGEAQDKEERDQERPGNPRSATELHSRMNLGKEELPLAWRNPILPSMQDGSHRGFFARKQSNLGLKILYPSSPPIGWRERGSNAQVDLAVDSVTALCDAERHCRQQGI